MNAGSHKPFYPLNGFVAPGVGPGVGPDTVPIHDVDVVEILLPLL